MVNPFIGLIPVAGQVLVAKKVLKKHKSKNGRDEVAEGYQRAMQSHETAMSKEIIKGALRLK